jgi:hypothetical protein
MAAPVGYVSRVVAKMDERVVLVGRLHVDVAAPAAVAARRTTPRDDLLAAEGRNAVSAVARLDVDLGSIEELHDT